MRLKFIVIVISFILLFNFISMEARSGEELFNNTNYHSNTLQNSFNSHNNKVNDLLNITSKAFTENCGQLENDAVRFYAQGGEIWFTDDGVWFEVRDELSINSQQSTVYTRESNLASDDWRPEAIEYKSVVLKQEFMGANLVRPMGSQKLGYYSNFFYGNDSSKWYTEVSNFQEICYENLYDDIDLRYYTSEKGLKYDFIIHPGADVGQIRIRYDGADGLEIDALGNLIIKTQFKNIVDGSLVIYQNLAEFRHQVQGRFIKLNELEYGFQVVNDYDHEKDLIIDPLLNYSTYVGGKGWDFSLGIALDSSGNAYMTGYTNSTNFPTTTNAYKTSYTGGNWDAHVFKINHNGSNLIYCTYFGGDDEDKGLDISVDAKGNAYVTGITQSLNFPTTPEAYDKSIRGLSEAFILKLNQSGKKLDYSTYIGGSGYEYGYGIKTDLTGNVFITGIKTSPDFPHTPGAYNETYGYSTDTFILKLNSNGSSLIYSAIIGGSKYDISYDIAIDLNGNAFITGTTTSFNFPITPNANDSSYNGGDFVGGDCFVLKLNYNGSSLIYSTYIGGDTYDIGKAITVDTNGNSIVIGETWSSNFPTTQGAYETVHQGGSRDIFVSKLNHTGSKLIFSTFIGGNNNDWGDDIILDPNEDIYITGETQSANFPITPDAYDSSVNYTEAFILKLDRNCSKLLYSTFIGGTIYDHSRCISLDSKNNVYISGTTLSSDFPTTVGAYDTTKNGMIDIFVQKYSFSPYNKINSISLLKNEIPAKLIYSRLCPYTFRINITDTESQINLEKVTLNLDPLGINVQFLWDRITGQFLKINDANNYVSIKPSSSAYYYFHWWTIDFNITFNWTYPDELHHDVQASATSKIFSPVCFTTTNLYQVENDLVFNGTLSVKDENNRNISNGELVCGGKKFIWTGLTAVYENTTTVYPPEDIIDFILRDKVGTKWTASPLEGQPFHIESFIPNTSYFDDYIYTINLSGIPPECDKTSVTFSIRIDGDNVTFSDPAPDGMIWQTTSDVLVTINITDIGGGLVNGTSIMRSVSSNDGKNWGPWKSIKELESGLSLIAGDVVNLNEGKNNLIKWKAKDTLGNGPAISNPNRILIDTEVVTFSGAFPSSSEISPIAQVEVGINISDTTSGVDASAIEYKISQNKGSTWSSWHAVEGLKDSKTVEVNINLTFSNGTDNMLKWRASDIAGNDPVESRGYLINVNTWQESIKPRAILLSPSNAMTINETTVELKWELEDASMEGVIYDVFFGNISPPGILKSNITTTTFIVENLEDRKTYYWKIIPKIDDIEGTCSTGLWFFKVELIKDNEVFKINITGPESISLNPGENKSIILTIQNLGTVEDMIKLELDAGKLSEYITLNDLSILTLNSNSIGKRTLEINLSEAAEPGNYEIIITAISINSGEIERDNHKIIIEIKEPIDTIPDESDQKSSKKSANTTLIILIIIVSIIIIIIVIFVTISKRKNRIEPELPQADSITIKPKVFPKAILPQDNISGSPPVVQPSAASLSANLSLQTSVPTTPRPMLLNSVSTGESSTQQQIPRITHLPQLLQAAQNQTQELNNNESTLNKQQ